MTASLDASGRCVFNASSDSELTRGLAAVVAASLSGLTPEEVLQVSAGRDGQAGHPCHPGFRKSPCIPHAVSRALRSSWKVQRRC